MKPDHYNPDTSHKFFPANENPPKPQRQPRVHRVKSWVPFFQAIKRGDKTHDLRKDDRGYNVGDQLVLSEYDQTTGRYTGDRFIVDITFITDRRTPCAFSSAVLPPEYCILSIQKRKSSWT